MSTIIMAIQADLFQCIMVSWVDLSIFTALTLYHLMPVWLSFRQLWICRLTCIFKRRFYMTTVYKLQNVSWRAKSLQVEKEFKNEAPFLIEYSTCGFQFKPSSRSIPSILKVYFVGNTELLKVWLSMLWRKSHRRRLVSLTFSVTCHCSAFNGLKILLKSVCSVVWGFNPNAKAIKSSENLNVREL